MWRERHQTESGKGWFIIIHYTDKEKEDRRRERIREYKELLEKIPPLPKIFRGKWKN